MSHCLSDWISSIFNQVVDLMFQYDWDDIWHVDLCDSGGQINFQNPILRCNLGMPHSDLLCSLQPQIALSPFCLMPSSPSAVLNKKSSVQSLCPKVFRALSCRMKEEFGSNSVKVYSCECIGKPWSRGAGMLLLWNSSEEFAWKQKITLTSISELNRCAADHAIHPIQLLSRGVCLRGEICKMHSHA